MSAHSLVASLARTLGVAHDTAKPTLTIVFDQRITVDFATADQDSAVTLFSVIGDSYDVTDVMAVRLLEGNSMAVGAGGGVLSLGASGEPQLTLRVSVAGMSAEALLARAERFVNTVDSWQQLMRLPVTAASAAPLGISLA